MSVFLGGVFMQTKGDSVPDLAGANVKCKKAPYHAPVLRVYGVVSQLTTGASGLLGDSGAMSMVMVSDRTLKQSVVRIGAHPAGFGFYLFDYKPGFRETARSGRQFGVMADEVETVLPQAVVMHPNGYKMVDYALLGIRFPDQTVH
jgi:hypothetical protein